ncbi:hypothetical protein IWW50_002490, partial [Coemansia erecta]
MSFSEKIALPLRTAWDISGAIRETLYWPCSSGKARGVMLMIPGNPGLADFYIDFLKSIHDRFIDDLDIICVSHLGHTRFADNHGIVYRNTKLYDFQEQISNLIDTFDAIDNQYASVVPRPKMFLCAHSTGCYFAQKICECRSDRVQRVFSLFPAIGNLGESPQGMKLRVIFKPSMRYVLCGGLVVLRWLLPLRAIHALAEKSDSLDSDNARLVVDKMLHAHCLGNVLRMVTDDINDVAGLDEQLYRELGGKFVMFYGRHDDWVPMKYYEKLREINTKGKVILCDQSIPHAFVTAKSKDMAMEIVKGLEEEAVAEDVGDEAGNGPFAGSGDKEHEQKT